MPVDILTLKARGQSPVWCGQKPSAMREVGIDLSEHRSKSVDEFDGQHFDYVITVRDSVRESCPVFFGEAKRLHHSFDDPAAMSGTSDERLAAFRRVRHELRDYLATLVAQAK